uniref:Ig-like domain-containing protein n=1 Tax=Monodelphis domestica TaxID=13616 RepID=A0A5F8H482_MONDO
MGSESGKSRKCSTILTQRTLQPPPPQLAPSHTLPTAWHHQAEPTERKEKRSWSETLRVGTQCRAGLGVILCLRPAPGQPRSLLPPASGSTMTPALSALLCLGLCLCKRTRTQATDGLYKPSLRAENGPLVPKGGDVTLRCRGSWKAVEWRLEKWGGSGWSMSKAVRQAGNEGEFSLPSVTPHDADTYGCLYRHSSYGWSERSDPLQLVVTGLSAPPSLAALPSSEVASGQSVTLQCRSELYYDMFALCKDGEEISRGRTRSHGWGRQADFFFPALTLTQDGTYRCFGFHSSSPSLWSSPSAPLLLRVSGEAAPAPPSSPRLPLCSGAPPCLFRPVQGTPESRRAGEEEAKREGHWVILRECRQ